MIYDYIKQNFKCGSDFSTKNDNSELSITGFKSKDVLKWVTSKLLTFLQNNYPQDWVDTLNQFCSDTNVILTPISQGSELWNSIND